ncbi:hypothetical protein NE237_015169 [Protea cynaroides]|uniref:3-dehydroquinate dehydratase n=1 Tax=Protea cynaroides TaxID=273540 RepID=A0A9Q0KDD3_9MAGN|nr:hypothetical protein NE237_015169 [Protea cynaroides]
MGQSVDEMLREIGKAKAGGADLVEVRLDYLSNFNPRQDIESPTLLFPEVEILYRTDSPFIDQQIGPSSTSDSEQLVWCKIEVVESLDLRPSSCEYPLSISAIRAVHCMSFSSGYSSNSLLMSIFFRDSFAEDRSVRKNSIKQFTSERSAYRTGLDYEGAHDSDLILLFEIEVSNRS